MFRSTSFVRLATITLAAAYTVCLSFTNILRADDETKPPKVPVEMADFVLQVVGDDDKPIAGVAVMAYAIRCQEEQGSHFGWPELNAGPKPTLKTDEQGMIKLKYPVKFGSEQNWMTTTEISMSLSHAEYVTSEVHLDPNTTDAKHAMKPGTALNVSARDEQSQPTTNFGVWMAGAGGSALWITTPDGMKRSRAIPDGTWQTLVVQPDPNGRHLFSGVLPVRLKEGQVVNLRDVPLRAGLQVSGALSEDVERPVKNGKIVAWCLPKPAGDVYADENPSVYWEEIVDINEDGTFVFPSLPRTGKIQIIAICDDWVVTSSEQKGRPVSGVRYDLDTLEIEDNHLANLEIPMERTGTLRVTAWTPEGDPIEGALVSSWPNQILDMGGSTILGTGVSTWHAVQRQIDPNHKIDVELSNWDQRFSGKTDAEGTVEIRTIPMGITHYFGVNHDDYVMERKDENKRDLDQFILDDEGVKELTVPMKLIKKP